jgi:alkylation response protein AidB-like acyl-CoA dehydrogenase
MTWPDIQLNTDQREVADLVRNLLPGLPPIQRAESAEEEAARGANTKAQLVESGIWSIGIEDELGGGGAPPELVYAALLTLGAEQPALAWAVAQAQAAASVMANHDGLVDLGGRIAAGVQPVAVVDFSDPAVQLQAGGGSLSGTIGRLDPYGDAPAVVVLHGEDAAWVIAPGNFTLSEVRSRTGFSGALTASARLDATGSAPTRVEGIDAGGVRAGLYRAGAAIAAGLASRAAKAAADYSQQRMQFGAPLAALPTVRASLTQQRAAAAALSKAALAAEALEVGEAAMLLHDAADGAVEVTAAAVQSHGGYGYLQEYGIERLVRDAVSLRAATGALHAMRRVSDRLAPSA